MLNSSTNSLSIIINNYNYSDFVCQAIKSALNQHCMAKVEVIVVDDGSTDNSREIIKNYAEKIIYYFQNNQGQASAFNKGFELSSGDIICFLDSDDFFYPNKLEEIIRLFEKYPEAGWLFHELEYLDKNGNNLKINNVSNVDTEKLLDFSSTFKNGQSLWYKTPCGMCFQRKLLAKILPMPISHDVSISDVYLRTAALILSPGIHSPQKLAIQRIHGKNIYTFQKQKKYLKAEIAIKTSFYLRKKFSEKVFDQYMNKSFVRALALTCHWIGFKETMAIPETRLYFKEHLSKLDVVKCLPRFCAYFLKFAFDQSN
jgi:glycosyltransferase involved in cell wall biosynthesis